MAQLSDLPVEVVLDNLLPSLSNDAIVSLGATSHFWDTVTNDDTFWKRKLREDFNFDCEATARESGWKGIYAGLTRPRTFVWGENNHGRLGVENLPRSSMGQVGIPFPAEVSIPGKRIISLVPGGTSFHALDSDGNVYVWGTLDGESFALQSDGFSDPSKPASSPHRLQLPSPIRSISSARFFSAMLASDLNIYVFRSWGAPYRLASDLLDTTMGSPDAPVQVECGWGFVSVLTRGGNVLVWWPTGGEFHRLWEADRDMRTEHARNGDRSVFAHASQDNVVPCQVWELRANPHRLPDLPRDLPELSAEDTGESEERRRQDGETRIVRVAALDDVMIALTNRGHVLRYRLEREPVWRQGRWEYLPEFSEVAKVKQHPAFTSPEMESSRIDTPQKMHITHISAHFNTFVVYSTGGSSIVLMGSTETTANSTPKIIPALQHRNVISVVLGDYHYGALTASGKLFTWGGFSKGALGLGDPADLEVGAPGGPETARQRDAARNRGPRAIPPEVKVPTEVRFDWGKKKRETFCFSAAAAGWHMGALVIDLEPPSQEDEDQHVNMPGSYQPGYVSPEQLEGPPLPFRAEGPPRRRGPLHVPVLPPRGRGGGQAGGLMMPFMLGHAAGRGAGGGPGPNMPDA